jgi:hypothetical protein
MPRPPPQLALGLGVGGAAGLGRQRRARLARGQPRRPNRLLRAKAGTAASYDEAVHTTNRANTLHHAA